MPIAWHVSISHPPAERDRAALLAERLLELDIPVAVDEWPLEGDEPRVAARPAGSWSEVLLVSPMALGEVWSPQLAQRLLAGAVAGRRRMVPLLIGELGEIPAPLRSRVCADFRTDPEFQDPARVWQLVAMLRGERAESPPPDDWPRSFTPFDRERSSTVSLRIAPERLLVTANGREAHEPLTAERAAWLEVAVRDGQADPREAERMLLGGAAGALLREVTGAGRAGAPRAELAVQVAHKLWQPFDWESLVALALGGPGVTNPGPVPRMYRVQPSRVAVSRGGVALPLEVLVVLSNPESRHGASSRVDPDRASRAALAAVAPACASGSVRVSLRERLMLAEIAEAVAARPPHVVLLVTPLRQGEILSSREDDREERVPAARLVTEALGALSPAPLVIVASAPPGDGAASRRDVALEVARAAYDLVAAGVPAALAVADLERSAPTVAALLAALAGGEALPVTEALARAEATVGRDAAPAPEGDAAPLASDLLLVTAHVLRPVVGAAAASTASSSSAATAERPGVVASRVELVDRRRELRRLRKVVFGAERAGAWIVGPEGIGKTALAHTLARRHDDGRRLVVELAGEVVPEDVVEAIGRRLEAQLRRAYERDDPEVDGREPLKVLAAYLQRREAPWRERWERLARESAGRISALVILDGFEANQDERGTIRDAGLNELVVGWPREAGAPRLVMTSRSMPPDGEPLAGRLETLALEPLDAAGATWMRLCLDHLATLAPALAARVEERAGGVPRLLRLFERMAARGGAGAIERLTEVSEEQLVEAALAVLVTGLVQPLADSVLRGALAYRVEVDELGLAWQVGTVLDPSVDAARSERLTRFEDAIRAARARGDEPSIASLGLTRDDQVLLEKDIAERLRPPVEVPEGLSEALDELVATGLLLRRGRGEGARYRVPGWIRSHLAARAGEPALAAAHRHAARYWHWRVRTLPRPAHADLADLVELWYHLARAGEREASVRIAEVLCTQLDAVGAVEREERVCRAVIDELGPEAPQATRFQHQLAIAARRRGRVSEARALVQGCASLEEARGDRAALARSWGELGVLAALEGDLDGAARLFDAALAGSVAARDRDGEAASLHHLALVARQRGALDDAAEKLDAALALRDGGADDVELAAVLLSLGDVERARKHFDGAAAALARALVLARAGGDAARAHRAWIGLALVARDRGQPEEAARQLQAALDAAMARGDRAAAAEAASQLGRLAELRGAVDEAWSSFRRALEVSERDGDRDTMIAVYLDLARIDQRRGHSIDALGWSVHAVAAALTIGSSRSQDALDSLAALARITGGGKRWRSSWRRAFEADPPPEVVAWVEASWWRRVRRRRERLARQRAVAH